MHASKTTFVKEYYRLVGTSCSKLIFFGVDWTCRSRALLWDRCSDSDSQLGLALCPTIRTLLGQKSSTATFKMFAKQAPQAAFGTGDRCCPQLPPVTQKSANRRQQGLLFSPTQNTDKARGFFIGSRWLNQMEASNLFVLQAPKN